MSVRPFASDGLGVWTARVRSPAAVIDAMCWRVITVDGEELGVRPKIWFEDFR